jgi:hypothetical protein
MNNNKNNEHRTTNNTELHNRENSWEYQRESVSCWLTLAQYTSLFEFAVPSLEFHCVLWFCYKYY